MPTDKKNQRFSVKENIEKQKNIAGFSKGTFRLTAIACIGFVSCTK